MTLDGLEVLLTRPDFASPPSLNGSRLATLTDLGRSRRYGAFPGKVATHALSHRYVLRGTEVRDFEDFFNARAGRWQRFLLPSWVYELSNGETNATGSSSGQPNLRIDFCDYAAVFNPAGAETSRLGHYVWILWPDATFFAAKVNSVASSTAGVHDTLALASNLPKAVTADHGQLIGFCYAARFAHDDLELTFRGPGTAECEVTYAEDVQSTPAADA